MSLEEDEVHFQGPMLGPLCLREQEGKEMTITNLFLCLM